MKIKQLIFSLLIFAGMPVMAQQALKFGHVNTQEIFKTLPDMAVVEKTIEEETKKQEAQLTTLQEELKRMQEAFNKEAETLTPETRTTRETELIEMNQRIQSFFKQAQQMLQTKQGELTAPLIKKVETAIKAVGEENGFLYIFEKETGLMVYLSTKSIDVTPLVKTKLGIVAQ